MKILVYGFKPYGNYDSNITEKIIDRITPNLNLKKVVFPVKFNQEMFINAVRLKKPDVVIGLGQCSFGSKIRIERKAINSQGSKNKGYQPIDRKGPRFQFENLKLKKDRLSRLSYKTGGYVCNFSIYVFSKWSRQNNSKFAFFHIPADFNVNLAVNFLKSKINEVKS